MLYDERLAAFSSASIAYQYSWRHQEWEGFAGSKNWKTITWLWDGLHGTREEQGVRSLSNRQGRCEEGVRNKLQNKGMG